MQRRATGDGFDVEPTWSPDEKRIAFIGTQLRLGGAAARQRCCAARRRRAAMTSRAIYDVLKASFRDFIADKVPRLGAAVAYYSIFSIAPLLVIAIGIASLIFGEQAAQGEIRGQIEGTVGPSAGRAVQDILHATDRQSGGVTATIVGLVVLLFGGSSVFVQLQDGLNTIWHVTPKPDRGWWTTIRERLLSFGVVVVVGFLLLVSLIVSAALSAANKFLTPSALPGGSSLWQVINALVSLGLVTLLLALLFKVLPDVKLAWRDVWIGALTTAGLFTVGKYLIGLYLAHGSTTSAFGAADSLVILLVWVYYSSQIVLFGAELTRQLVKRSGREVIPTDNAILIADETLSRRCRPRRANSGRIGQGVRS
jgi:membrane protein